MKHLLNKFVKITNRDKGVYFGKLVGFRPGKFCIASLIIRNAAGGTTASKVDTIRWFSVDRAAIEEILT